MPFFRPVPLRTPCSRRSFLAVLGLGLTAPGGLLRGADASPFAPFDHEMEAFMRARDIPGGALAVVKQGRLAYARGYGWADREERRPVLPETLFRIASLSKPITAVAVLKLVEQGRLEWDTKPFALLDLKPLEGQSPDPRLSQITLRQLLQHTAGWDRGQSGDPMFRSRQIARAAKTSPPAQPEAIIRYMLGRPLDFDPGTRYAYSNFGYCVLGRVIEKVTGQPYATWVREAVLTPAGIPGPRLGQSRSSQAGEAHYYTQANSSGPSVFDDLPARVPDPYGTFNLEAMDAHGGWLASARDLARFAAALDGPRPSPLLKPETLARMYAPPPAPVSRRTDGRLADSYYACGWSVRPVGPTGRANYWHTGSLPGTFTLLVRRWDGLSWVALFNQRAAGQQPSDNALDPALHRAADAVREWPAAQD